MTTERGRLRARQCDGSQTAEINKGTTTERARLETRQRTQTALTMPDTMLTALTPSELRNVYARGFETERATVQRKQSKHTYCTEQSTAPMNNEKACPAFPAKRNERRETKCVQRNVYLAFV